MPKTKLSIPSDDLTNKLQIAGITGTSLMLSGAEAAALFHLVARVSIYHATKGLPDELVELINRQAP